ncbi:cilia- and flagella-associated protein 45 isoform X2 [Daktulosphaira vitifoliae]|uniref:cilia- and flagella-associated protein 45 isoform X2 n=1 Tax=Daktulosphaira vitifoliae TaxID=58002 RepID=UPI0021AA918A|nr:cilia- and flagella-associated protein 45 isoform X2 [Daktulosphaira vitifoliae]
MTSMNNVDFNFSNEKITSKTNKKIRDANLCKLDSENKPFTIPPDLKFIDKNTYKRLKNKAKVITGEDRQMAVEQLISEREKLETESAARKKRLQNYDNLRTKGKKLAELDDEANKKANYLLARAQQLRQDQEDEIKCCNSLILSTKCHAIRNAQIAEKQLIQKEMMEEERRMTEMMEQERILASKKLEKAAEAEQLKKKLQAMEIMKQIKENEIAKEMENARLAEEARIRADAVIEAQREEVNDYKLKLEQQAALRKEFLQMNAQLRDIKKIEQEMNTIEILQIQEYTRQKNEREAAFEEETKKQKLLKDKTIAKIQASHKASHDLQAAKDELNALRVRDAVEREWRRKEHEEALKKVKEEEELKEARRQQIEDQKRNYAFEIQREKEEFDKIAELNMIDIEKSKELENKHKKRNTAKIY